jgi:hypothetical protein
MLVSHTVPHADLAENNNHQPMDGILLIAFSLFWSVDKLFSFLVLYWIVLLDDLIELMLELRKSLHALFGYR